MFRRLCVGVDCDTCGVAFQFCEAIYVIVTHVAFQFCDDVFVDCDTHVTWRFGSVKRFICRCNCDKCGVAFQ